MSGKGFIEWFTQETLGGTYELVVPVSMTLSHVYAYVGNEPGPSGSWTVNIGKNLGEAFDTTAPCSIAGSNRSCSATFTTAQSFSPGDRIYIEMLPTGNPVFTAASVGVAP